MNLKWILVNFVRQLTISVGKYDCLNILQYLLIEYPLKTIMSHLSLIISSFTTAILLPLTLSATENQQTVDVRTIPNDDIAVMMTPVEDATTAFINLDEAPESFDTSYNDVLAGEVIDYAESYLGRPYVYGAKGPNAFDCSGFTSYIFKKLDIDLSPSSRLQYTQGRHITLDEVRPGDLLFFAGRRGGKTVGHVAMAVDVNEDGTVKFIHASIKKGISYANYPDGGYYSKRFIGARRVIE